MSCAIRYRTAHARRRREPRPIEVYGKQRAWPHGGGAAASAHKREHVPFSRLRSVPCGAKVPNARTQTCHTSRSTDNAVDIPPDASTGTQWTPQRRPGLDSFSARKIGTRVAHQSIRRRKLCSFSRETRQESSATSINNTWSQNRCLPRELPRSHDVGFTGTKHPRSFPEVGGRVITQPPSPTATPTHSKLTKARLRRESCRTRAGDRRRRRRSRTRRR